MKNKKGIVLLFIALFTFGIIIAGCKDKDEAAGSDLIGKWYTDKALTVVVYEFKSNSTVDVVSGYATVSYSVKGDIITTTIAGVSGTIKYKIENNVLTLSEKTTSCALANLTLYR